MAREGDWIIGEARMSRATKDVAFADGRLHARGVEIVRASGVFKVMSRHG
jgi:acyl-coenzyme A thioesterase PaaI-like protein